MLDDLSTRVEHTDSKLRKVQRTMGDFIRRNEGEFLGIFRVYRIRSAHSEGRNKEWMVYIDINHCSHDLTVTRNHHMNKHMAWRVMFTGWVLELQAPLYGYALWV